ncbi:hydroxymethylbilane synthase [Erythrobacter aureus]|uniref:Porphobilinogen deaminase n=1 Tax=Erythrobacter aureus TaxID=2182384 RepID=A0A345YGQ7_9SPHN|nr:hydroxymethylbilane synthase [Erythrobacter aureus]AXK43109.1 hydroxymethylbilane synthase [Erythrobacter aureus]MBL43328.1 hydroxymethylbilane synthase [Sphingomonadaceae bacterium]
MPDQPLIRLGTRRSPLAMAQALEARARLCAAHDWDESAVELVPVVASGDKIQDRPLAEIGGKALWTRELDHWLLEGRIDAAVHSMKDVETIRPEAIAIGAILPRADKADRLLGAASIADIPAGARVGTSAPRRAAQLLNLRPDLNVVGIRGNVATRMAKLAAGAVDATFLAAAGLDRLGADEEGVRLDPEAWLPAPAQAAIGLECRSNDARMCDLLGPVDHPGSHAEIRAERRLLEGLGGSCSSPIAALSHRIGERMSLNAAIFSPDGKVRIAGNTEFAIGDENAPFDLAKSLLDGAPPEVAEHFGYSV